MPKVRSTIQIMIDELSEQRLQEELIFSIRQFQRYANMRPIDRNNFVVQTLNKLLEEANRMQLQESLLCECKV